MRESPRKDDHRPYTGDISRAEIDRIFAVELARIKRERRFTLDPHQRTGQSNTIRLGVSPETGALL